MKVIHVKELIVLLLLSLSLFFSSINSLPVLDRDEARYVQSSKQMVESNNYLSIKFQEEYRSKKPIGIYWLQAFSINLLSSVSEINNLKYEVLNDNIWKYRVISAIAVLLCILSLYLLSKNIIGREASFNASLILASSLLVIAEAHIAKTDSILLLLSTIIFITLLKYFKRIKEKNIFNFFLLWTSIGLSILIKGPILILLFCISIICISLIEKNIIWIKNTKPFLGLLLVILISVPWYFFMPLEEQKNFLQESFFHDFLGKVISTQENHGGVPGFYLIGLFIFFLPFSIFFFPLIKYLKISIRNKSIIFLLCWLLPCLIIMELVPTKLPHYILPIYPAIAVLMGIMLANHKSYKSLFFTKYSYFGYFIYFFISNGLLLMILKANAIYGQINILYYLILFLLNNLVFIFIFKKQLKNTFYYLVFYSNVFSAILYILIIPSFTMLWTSRNIAISLKNNEYIENKSTVASIGYNEPSLVFEVGTNIKVFKSIDKFSENFSFFDYLIIEKDYYIELNKKIKGVNLEHKKISSLIGFNAAKGQWIEIYLLKKL
jgi:hypothetical protein